MRLLLCSVGLAVCPVLAVCQHPVPANLSLADAVTLARPNSPLYRQAINDRGPAAWGVRSAWSTLLVPSVSASGGIGYAGPGQQTFLTSNFSQSVSTVSSSYSLGLDWTLSGQTLTQPGLRKAQPSAGADGGPGRKAPAVSRDGRDGPGGPRGRAAHRYLHCAGAHLAAERPAHDGRAAEPGAQGAARA